MNEIAKHVIIIIIIISIYTTASIKPMLLLVTP